MAGMGDPTVGDWTAFSKILSTCEPETSDDSDFRPTISEDDLYFAPEHERDLMEAVCCGGHCVVAFGSQSLRTSLTVALLKEMAPRLAVVLVQTGDEQRAYVEHLEILLPSQVSWEDTAEGVRPEGVLLMEPKTFVDILARETVVPRQVEVLVLRNFEQYLQPDHAYRRILRAFEGAPTRLLSLVDSLPAARSMDDLETNLRTLRTSRGLPLRAAMAARPYSKESSPEPVLLESDWLALEQFLAGAEDERIRDLKDTLRREGIVTAMAHAKLIDSTHPDLLEFLARGESLLLDLGCQALLNLRRGATLALTASGTTHTKVTRWLTRRGIPITDLLLHEESAREKDVVVATLADLPTVQRWTWDTVVLFDLPHGAACDALLRKTNRKFALCTEPQWKQWQSTLRAHDSLQDLFARVNQ